MLSIDAPGLDTYGGTEQYGSDQYSAPEEGLKRKRLTHEEGVKKIKRTIGWYNHNGGLASQIIYKNLRDSIESVDPRQALKILKELDEKKDTIRNPTSWIQKAVERVGPDLDMKVKKTIAWYNKNGGLMEPIRYDDVKGVLAILPPKEACSILKSLDGKGEVIHKPTSYIYRAAQRKVEQLGYGYGYAGYAETTPSWVAAPKSKPAPQVSVVVPPLMAPQVHQAPQALQVPQIPQVHQAQQVPVGAPQFPVVPVVNPWAMGTAPTISDASVTSTSPVDEKVKRTIAWYNKNGSLQQEIRYDTVAPALALISATEALQILKGLDGKGPTIRNPTAWVKSAAEKKFAEAQVAISQGHFVG